ncbi:hypothetical protein CLF_105402 [Clonorchis sinensis]|uniref:Uncharacterized protein n=1 Tax=Clonorchis sinensis TaxID=79923 RepID=G7YDH4_CLOSI|nr:hypothetical protein CLF_105402 [Clonorchis sinensis]
MMQVFLSAFGSRQSTYNKVDYIDPEAPRDTLDFRLNSVYDQHGDYNKNLQESVLQKESLRPLTECQLKTLKDAKAERLPPYTCLKGHGNEKINIITIIGSMTLVFNTGASLPYTHDLFENPIVKKRIKMDEEGTYCYLTTIIPRCLHLQTLIEAIWIENDNKIATDVGWQPYLAAVSTRQISKALKDLPYFEFSVHKHCKTNVSRKPALNPGYNIVQFDVV